MMRHLLPILVLLILASPRPAFCQATAAPSPFEHPQWIWCLDSGADADQPFRPNHRCHLIHKFSLEASPRSAKLRFAADFCAARVEINGRTVAGVEPYCPAVDVEVTSALLLGENRIEIVATAVPGPAAVALSMSVISVDETSKIVVTNRDWETYEPGPLMGRATSLGLVEPSLWGINRRPATIDPFDNYEQWRQAIGTPATNNQAAFWTAPGFAISLIREAQPDEGSWVSMAFDPRGRLTIAREDKGLLRLTLDESRSMVERVETINDDLQECRGLLYAHDALYANANNSKGLYRLRDTDRDDRFDEIKLLREFPGSVGHGRNDLALGPDGLIYSIHGDAVDVPKDAITDYTSPFREARRGKNSREGYLLRTDRDGAKWELLTAGLRNPFGVAFNPRGDIFTYDADAEFDMGSPWYRPTRVDQLVTGGDFGWRGVTGKWPPYFCDHADNAFPTLDIGRGSPTAVAFGTHSNFPGDYRRALFILDWSYGRVLAVHLAPRGAGYRGCAETFLKGRPLNVTDLAFGPDGALYLITGGRKTQSALYRVSYTGPQVHEPPPSSHEVACLNHADKVRQLRLDLESRCRAIGQEAVDFAWPHLASTDPQIRFAARTVIEHQPMDLWRERALARGAPLEALMAVARSGEKALVPRLIVRLPILPSYTQVRDSLGIVHMYFLCLQMDADAVKGQRAAIVGKMEPLFPHSSAQHVSISPAGSGADLNRELARLLGQLQSPSIIERVGASLLSSRVQEDRLQGLFVLRDVKSGWTPAARRNYFAVLNEASSAVGGEGMPKFLAQIREQAVATLSDAEREQLADLLAPPTDKTDEPLPPARALLKRWAVDDLEPLLQGASAAGSAAKGETVFRDALCARCHRAGAHGPAVGPDLTHVAGRFSPRDILESILLPNKVVAENYRNVQIATTDGRQLVGRVLLEGDFRSEKLKIAAEPLRPSVILELSKREIDQVREIETSPMPQGLLDSFSQQEILDLLAFLVSGSRNP